MPLVMETAKQSIASPKAIKKRVIVSISNKKQLRLVYLRFIARSLRELTRNICKNTMAIMAIKGEMSIPNFKENGRTFLIRDNIGSVVLSSNWTMGLKGSGFTQLISALISMSTHKMFNTIFMTWASAIKKLEMTNIFLSCTDPLKSPRGQVNKNLRTVV
jgi:hypothetical protein